MSELLKTKKDMREFKKWIIALRSGEYKQTRWALENDLGFCSLGLACKTLIPEKHLVLNHAEFIFGTCPTRQTNAPKWLKEIDDDFMLKTSKYLTRLNDDEKFTFNEIADCLEAVYIHKVLD